MFRLSSYLPRTFFDSYLFTQAHPAGMGKSRRSPNASPQPKESPAGTRRSLERQVSDGKRRKSPSSTSLSSHGSASAETVPYNPVDAHRTAQIPSAATSPSSNASVRSVKPAPKGQSVVDLTSPSATTHTPSQEALTEFLHCSKGIVYSRLPYATLWECTPCIDNESTGTSTADWVAVGAMLTSLHEGSAGIIREFGKDDKRMQQVPNLNREYAIETLTTLVLQWATTQATDAPTTVVVQPPRVLLKRNSDDTWCFPGGKYTNDNTRIPTSPEVISLAKWVTAQTGL